MSRRTVRMLAELRAKMGFVPITTRSLAQYRRMTFPAEIMPHFALVANGALLLCDGATDATWQNKTKAVAALARNELLRLAEKLAADYAFRGKPPQLIDDIFLFVASIINNASFWGDMFLDKVEKSGRFFMLRIQRIIAGTMRDLRILCRSFPILLPIKSLRAL